MDRRMDEPVAAHNTLETKKDEQDTASPYTAPASNLDTNYDEPTQAFAMVPASRLTRFLNYVIDYVGMIGTAILVMIIMAFVLDEATLDKIEDFPDFMLGVMLILIYYLPLELFFGRTLGKLITGTRVVNYKGLPASFSQILIRSCSRVVPFEPFSFFNSKARGWHDSWSKTYVIKVRK